MTKLTSFSPEDKKLNTRIYDKYHKTYRWEDGWSKGHKVENYHAMMRLVEFTGIPISGASCLDVGCGTGDLSLFLRQRGCRRYLGIDIYEPSLEKARVKYPEETFLHADLLADVIKGKFQYAFCSGSLTIKLKTADNYDFLQAMVAKMWAHTKVGIVFNVLTTDPEPDPELFFYDIPKVLEICKIIAPKAHSEVIENEDIEQAHFYLWR